MKNRFVFHLLMSLTFTAVACGDDDTVFTVADFGVPREAGPRDLGRPPVDGNVPPTDGGQREGGGGPPGLCSSDDQCALGRRLRACCECVIPLTKAEIDSDECVVGADEEYGEALRVSCRPDRSRCIGECMCPTWAGIACDDTICNAYGPGMCRFDSECGEGQRCIDRNGDGRTECVSSTDYCASESDCAPGQICRDFDLDLVTTCGPPVECVLDLECDSGSTGPCIDNVCTGRGSDAGTPTDDGGGPMVTRCSTDAQCESAGLEGYVCGDLEGDGMRECIPDPAPCGGCPDYQVCIVVGTAVMCVPTT